MEQKYESAVKRRGESESSLVLFMGGRGPDRKKQREAR